MNNPIQALAQMAMNRISSDPNFQRNPQAKAFMDSPSLLWYARSPQRMPLTASLFRISSL